MSISIHIVNEVNEIHALELYLQAGWLDESDKEYTSYIRQVIAGSTVFAAAYEGERLTGIGRAISDGCSDAYIQDIVVHRDYRKRGIGRKIVCAIVKALQGKNIDWIGLVAQPGTQAFYEHLGFQVMKNHIPMKFEPSKGIDGEII